MSYVRGYSQRENVRKLEAFYTYVTTMMACAGREADEKIPADQVEIFKAAKEEVEEIADKDVRLREVMRLLFRYVAFTDTKEGMYYVDTVSMHKLIEVLAFLKYVVALPPLDNEGVLPEAPLAVEVSKAELKTRVMRYGYKNYLEFYKEHEDTSECQLALWLLVWLDLELYKIFEDSLVFRVFATNP